MTLKRLNTMFRVQLPHEVQQYMTGVLNRYAETQLKRPKLMPGKLVIETNELPVGGITHVVRSLVTADFEPEKAKSTLAQVLQGQQAELGYWESWMLCVSGSVDSEGFEVHQAQIYVHRDGGWGLVHTEEKDSRRPQITDENDVWPEPAGEPPANKGIVDLSTVLTGSEARELVEVMLAAGATRIHDEVIVDMRNDKQRRAFWKLRRLVP